MYTLSSLKQRIDEPRMLSDVDLQHLSLVLAVAVAARTLIKP